MKYTQPVKQTCCFIQGTFGNIIVRVKDPNTGPGVTLTLHQIICLQIPLKSITDFNVNQFKAFYSLGTIGEGVYKRLTSHNEPERRFLEALK